jgi:S1-C subfamily serine protease
LQAGDLLVRFDGTYVRNVPQLNWALLHKRPRDQVKVEVWRKSYKAILDVLLTRAPPNGAGSLSAIDIEESLVPKLGIVASIPKQMANCSTAGTSSSGVLVMARLRLTDSRADLAAGDVIRSLNTIPINSVAQLREMLDRLKPGDAIALQVEHKGKPMYVAFEMD